MRVPVVPVVQVELAWSPAPRRVELLALALPEGSCVADAVRAGAARWLADGLSPDDWVAAVWGRRVAPEALLRAGDRIELCRGLQVDPKEARRLRYQAQGGRATRLTRGAAK
jgi:putative ubiquitin-RnfH superfamily antitoxin RatB of RatAB toxin-antitoxin module